jgi:site-specific recombinase XerD
MKWTSTKFKGVRYREVPTKKNGIRTEQYFAIRFQRDGKRAEEGLGLESEGWTAEKAFLELAKLKEAHKLGSGPTSLQEKRDIEKSRKEAVELERKKQELENVSFADFFKDTYLPTSKTHKKSDTWYNEDLHVRLWIGPVVGSKPFKKIAPLDIERIKKNLLDQSKSPRTIQYVMATFRQVWNMARRDGLVVIDSPTRSVKLPKVDNKRDRFLTNEEADKLLSALKCRSLDTYRMSAISLYTGMRRGEIFSLKWRNVDTTRGIIRIMDPKAGKTQYAYMNDSAKKIFLEMKTGNNEDLVFPGSTGEERTETPDIFDIVLKELGLNKGVTDGRHKVYFHTFRHTFASWLVLEGVDLYRVQKLMRHSNSAMTERYSHLAPDTLQSAVNAIDKKGEAA